MKQIQAEDKGMRLRFSVGIEEKMRAGQPIVHVDFIPMRMFDGHEATVKVNHPKETLTSLRSKRLAAREALAILSDLRVGQLEKVSEEVCLHILNAMVDFYERGAFVARELQDLEEAKEPASVEVFKVSVDERVDPDLPFGVKFLPVDETPPRAMVDEKDDPDLDAVLSDVSDAMEHQEAPLDPGRGKLMTMMEIMEKIIAEGGAIVSSNVCSAIEIADAQARGDFAVSPEGYGFVRRTPEWLALAQGAITERRLNKEAKAA